MRWHEVVTSWKTDAHAAAALTESILRPGHRAVLWETSPSATGEEPYEQRVVPAPALARIPPDPGAFREHLTGPVNTFDNLSGRSRLVAPQPPGDAGHLASFLRSASTAQVVALWRTVAEEIEAWWSDPTRDVLWVSTHGTGVPWLHVRLDPRPKYYRSHLRDLRPVPAA